MLQGRNTKIWTAWIAMIAIVFVMLFSVIYISQHVDHECTGSECPICAVMEQCSNNIKSIGAMAAIIVATLILYSAIQKGVQYIITVCLNCSLVFQKVRMNN